MSFEDPSLLLSRTSFRKNRLVPSSLLVAMGDGKCWARALRHTRSCSHDNFPIVNGVIAESYGK